MCLRFGTRGLPRWPSSLRLLYRTFAIAVGQRGLGQADDRGSFQALGSCYLYRVRSLPELVMQRPESLLMQPPVPSSVTSETDAITHTRSSWIGTRVACPLLPTA